MDEIRFGPFVLDARTEELRRDGELVPLARQPFRLLLALARRPGELVTREELRQEVWGDGTFVDFERGLNFCVLQARTALGDDAKKPAYIETLPRRGYRFIGGVLQASGLPPTPREARGLHYTWPLIAAAAFAILVFAIAWQRREAPPAGKIMLAVLPFDGADTALADGITDELITHLGAIQPRRLGVIARTSILTYRGTTKSVRDIGRELGVGYLIEGSVRREGGRVRVTAQLVDARDQTQLWSESYDRDGAGALAIQRDIAGRVAQALRVELLDDATLASRSPAAHEAYLRARHLLISARTPEVEQAVRELREAIRIEPSFALAHIALAEALHVLAMRERVDTVVAGEEIRVAGETARRLAPRLAQSHGITAMHQFWYAWDFDAAEESYADAIRLNPNEPGALHDHGWLLITRGRFDDGIALIRRAQELDPVSPRANMHVAWAYIYTRRYADAVRESRRALALSPAYREAYRCLEEAYVLSGNATSAAEARRLHGSADHFNDRDPYYAAVHFVRKGDSDQAIESLRKSKSQRQLSFVLAGADPKLAPLHGDVRFVEMLRSAGIALTDGRPGT
jgi:TolB-like protein/DNA-binding winged helix-turn-helix (wHTH) protein